MRPFSRIEALFLAALFGLLGLGWYLASAHREYFESVFIIEDGVVEVLSVLALLGASATCVVRMIRLRSVRPTRFLVGLGLFAAAFIFGAGEELSWGQRIFAIESGEFFKTYNSQAETNLHNLVLGGVRINKVVFGALLAVVIATFVLIMPWLYRRKEGLRRLIDGWAIPVPRGIHAVSYLVGALIVESVRSSRHGELRELIGCTLFLLIVLFPANRAIFSASHKL